MPGTAGKSKQSAYMKRCVADLVAQGKDTSAAFAICKAGGNKAGYFKPGSMELTGKGKQRSKELAKEPDMGAKEKAYQALLQRKHEDVLGEAMKMTAERIRDFFLGLRKGDTATLPTKPPFEITCVGVSAGVPICKWEGKFKGRGMASDFIEAAEEHGMKIPSEYREATETMLARLEAYPAAIEQLMVEGWNPDDVLAEAVSGVSVADAVDDLIADYADVGEISLAAIGRELMDIGKNNADNVRKAVQALKKAGIKVVRR